MKFEKISTNRAKFTFEVTPHEFEHGLRPCIRTCGKRRRN